MNIKLLLLSAFQLSICFFNIDLWGHLVGVILVDKMKILWLFYFILFYDNIQFSKALKTTGNFHRNLQTLRPKIPLIHFYWWKFLMRKITIIYHITFPIIFVRKVIYFVNNFLDRLRINSHHLIIIYWYRRSFFVIIDGTYVTKDNEERD